MLSLTGFVHFEEHATRLAIIKNTVCDSSENFVLASLPTQTPSKTPRIPQDFCGDILTLTMVLYTVQ